MKTLVINTEYSSGYYTVFYLLAVVACFVYLMFEGRRRNFPCIPWMMIIATAFLFFMLGCRLITLSQVEWNYIYRFERIPHDTARSVLGGILFSIPGILLAKKYLGFKNDLMDAFAFALPLALAIERFGCLFAGCCYGEPSDLPWAVTYGSHSYAFFQQLRDGVLYANSTMALPVHPVQVYEAFCCVIIIFLLTRLSKIMKAPGNLFLTSIGLYGALRFFLEFLRAGRHHIDNHYPNYIQWIILLIIPLLVFLIRKREKERINMVTSTIVLKGPVRWFLHFLILIVVFKFISRWLGVDEIISFWIVLLPLSALLVRNLFFWTIATSPTIRIFFLPLLACLLMSQTLPEYANEENKRISYNTVSLGWMGGNGKLSNYASYNSPGCFGPIYTTASSKYDHKYSAIASGISRAIQIEEHGILSFGINGFVESHREIFESYQKTSSYSDGQTGNKKFNYFGIKPFIQFDHKKFGWGAGLHFGRLGNINYPDYKYGGSSVSTFSTYPSFNLRFGDLNKIFIEYRFANQFPISFPVLNNQFALGVGFFKKNAGNIRLGTASHVSFFMAPTIPIGKQIVAEAYVGGGRGFAHQYGQVHNFTGSIGVHYKFKKKEK